ncbi:MAG: glutathione S-transferase family protein [Proteobacteria bacterium]|nr:glutathione S-transferase family protein [Pseudomonadota bacterium]
MAELQLIGVPQSNFVWVCRIACAEKGVAYTLEPARPHTPEVDAIHPFGKIPAMRHGDVTLCESRAICGYIDRTFSGPPLIPADPVKAAHVEQWVSMINTTIDPVMVRQYLLAYFFPGTPDGSPNRPQIDTALPKMAAQFGILERTVAKTGYLVGDSFTLADIDLLPILYYVAKLPESSAMLDSAKGLRAYFERHMARPSVKETTPPPIPGRS